MKIKKTLILFLATSILTFNTGCTDYNSFNPESNIQEMTVFNENNELEGIKKNSYENLVFSNDFTIDEPNSKKFDTFEMTIKPSLSPDELYYYFDETVEQYYPGIFSKSEKDKLYDINGTDKNGNRLEGGYKANKNKILSGEVDTPWLWFNNKYGMIQMLPNGAIQSVTCSTAFNIDNTGMDTVGMYCAADSNDIVKKLHVPIEKFICNTSYSLLDGSTKIDDAINFTENFLNTKFDSEIANSNFIADVTDVWVIDMGNGIYGYHFWLTSTYNGIRFDTSPMKNGLGFSADMSSCKLYDLYPGYAFMIESDKLDSVMSFGHRRAYNINNIQSYEMQINVDSALDILSKEISSETSMEINRAEFVYTPYSIIENDTTQLKVDAAWKFMAKNERDNFGYIFFVNAITGEIDYYKY